MLDAVPDEQFRSCCRESGYAEIAPLQLRVDVVGEDNCVGRGRDGHWHRRVEDGAVIGVGNRDHACGRSPAMQDYQGELVHANSKPGGLQGLVRLEGREVRVKHDWKGIVGVCHLGSF